MLFNFDTVHERRSSGSIKWNRYKEGVLPLWVADMDFQVAPVITEALHKAVDSAIHGYNQATDSLNNIIVRRMRDMYDWHIEAGHIVWLPGLVPALNVACRMVEGSVVTLSPIYAPFLAAPKLTGRELINIPMDEDASRWSYALPELSGNEELFLFCNPHNPIGRVYESDELEDLEKWVIDNDLLICSDEVHCDLILDKTKKHIPIASLSDEIAKRSITLMAASKSWNLPGLNCAFAIIPDSHVRKRFIRQSMGLVAHASTLGLVACEAAFSQGDEWREACLEYLRGNAELVDAFVCGHKGLSWQSPEATYLAWIDVRNLHLEDAVQFFEKSGVGIQGGAEFGRPGFIRLNFACSRNILREALARMSKALEVL